ncbi:hypothetical protein P8452_44487 [Trifolium repens]|nr:hypothetical protein P8452_44487 [Trifolium repens]
MRKISFIAYSIGGLVARYAIGRLYNAPENEADAVGTICGLLAVNFLTLATPHIGSIVHKQVPIFLVKTIFDKVARIFAPCKYGNTGRHLSANPTLTRIKKPWISKVGSPKLKKRETKKNKR